MNKTIKVPFSEHEMDAIRARYRDEWLKTDFRASMIIKNHHERAMDLAHQGHTRIQRDVAKQSAATVEQTYPEILRQA